MRGQAKLSDCDPTPHPPLGAGTAIRGQFALGKLRQTCGRVCSREVVIEERSRLAFVARHEMAVSVIGQSDARVAKVCREALAFTPSAIISDAKL